MDVDFSKVSVNPYTIETLGLPINLMTQYGAEDLPGEVRCTHSNQNGDI